jgi:hypothetical protein
MELFTKDGKVAYRAKCLALEQPARFVQCLGANTWFAEIQFQSANALRQAEMVERQQGARAARGGADVHPRAGQRRRPTVLLVPQPRKRRGLRGDGGVLLLPGLDLLGQRAGVRCKHQIALVSAIDRGEIRTF